MPPGTSAPWLDERGTNGADHVEDFLLFASKTRRDGRTSLQAPTAGNVIRCSDHWKGDGRKPGMLGVDLTIKESIASDPGPGDIVPERTSARTPKVRTIFRHRGATTSIVGYAPTETPVTPEKTMFRKTLGSSIAEVPTNEHLILTMNVNTRTGKEGEG